MRTGSAVNSSAKGRGGVISSFVALTKPRVVVMVSITTAAGYVLAPGSHFDAVRFLITLLAGAFGAGGTMALNQWMERDADALMNRTRHRPLPSGRLAAAPALIFGLFLTISGVWLLHRFVNSAAAGVGLAVTTSYLLLYTPLKRITHFSSIIGCVPGALPPVLGWFAAGGAPTAECWLLFGLLFFWQIPHLFAISWLYRRDYARAGMRVLPAVNPESRLMTGYILLSAAALIVVAPGPVRQPGTAPPVLFIVLGLTVIYLGYSIQFIRKRSAASAKQLILSSYLYLPGVLFSLVIQKLIEP